MIGPCRDFTALYGAARARKIGATEELLRAYQAELGAFIRRRLGWRAREAWEDIRQDTMITVVDRLCSYPADLHEAEFRAYLFQTAKRKIWKHHRRRSHELYSVDGSRGVFDPCAEGMGPATEAGVRDECRRIGELIQKLRSVHAVVLRCVLLEHRSVGETASVLGLSEDAARKRLQRAGAELVRLLGFGVPPAGGLLVQSQSRLKAGRRTGPPEGGTPN